MIANRKALLTTLLMATPVFVIVILASPSPVSAWTVGITADACAAHGDTVTVPVMAYNVTSAVPDIASAVYNIQFNASVVNVTGVASGSVNALPVSDWNFIASDTVRILAMDTDTGHTGDVNLANVTFKAVGSAGSSSTLRITDAQFTNYAGELITPDAINNGLFTIPMPLTLKTVVSATDFTTGPGSVPPGELIWVLFNRTNTTANLFSINASNPDVNVSATGHNYSTICGSGTFNLTSSIEISSFSVTVTNTGNTSEYVTLTGLCFVTPAPTPTPIAVPGLNIPAMLVLITILSATIIVCMRRK